jgi:glyoxylase-like metal-dependent hydrolase (beta-lactamase superfamily II)
MKTGIRIFFILGFMSLASASNSQAGPLLPHEWLEIALNRHGSGPLTVAGEGMVDLDVLQQGMAPGTSEPAPHHERLTISADGELAFDYDTPVNSDAREKIRYIWDGEKLGGLVLAGGFGFWETRADFPPRLRGLAPHLLLKDLVTHAENIKYLDRPKKGNIWIGAEAPTGEKLRIHMLSDGTLKEVSTKLDIPMRGDTVYRLKYMPYEDIEGFGAYPSGYEIWLDDDLLKRVRYVKTMAAPDEGLLTIPDTIRMPPYEPATETSADPAIAFQDLAPGLYLARHVRPGFHHLVAEQDDGLIVVDAPSGWREMHVTPPLEWVDGATSSSISHNFLKALEERFPGKPVKTLVLTHWHSDHAGGLREFVAHGATIAATSPTRQAAEKALTAPFTLKPDALTRKPTSARFLNVDERLSLGTGPARLQLFVTGPNPHASNMVVVHAPEANILYQADLFEPVPRRAFPPQQRLEVMRWFVTWLDSKALGDARILAAHALGEVEPWMLEHLRNMPDDDQSTEMR